MEQTMREPMRERDLVLPPNTFAYVLDRTKGKVSAYVGPFRSSLSDTDMLVVWHDGRFIITPETEKAVRPFVEAGEGQYIVLTNPAREERFPAQGVMNDTTNLETGKKIVIPGPATFPLWPGQSAQVIDGHHLRHNQYLVVRVYEPEGARANADRALVAPQTTGEGTTNAGDEGTSDATLGSDFTMGQLIVIRGVDVSFYVPPTGIEVVPESPGQFVRDAATLEQLEYCVLLDENGRKRFEQGPKVVFPSPTETFDTDKDGYRKFRAIELNPQSGLYIKVIARYEEDGVEHSEGEELFLTGKDTPIYFPRMEHSIIQYGDKRKHHAIAIPEGEGRYVLDRAKGEVGLTRGPAMFLPDPRTQVIVRRVLKPEVVEMMYPGNTEAMEVNRGFQAEQDEKLRRSRGIKGVSISNYLEAEGSPISALAATPDTAFGGEKMRRGTEYAPPRTITLDTKYEGAVAISVWPGYSVLVMDKSGNRRVELGPVNLLLEYDESLMVLALSTGRPKSDERKLRTPYLRTINNSVSDRVTVETRDLVPVTIDLSLRVNFEQEHRERWFDVEDYVALLTDHCRSKLRNLAKRHEIQEFYTQTIDLIRDALLGSSENEGRAGMSFEENGMRLYDVEVLGVTIEQESVEHLLSGAMDKALQGAITLAEAEQDADREARIQELRRDQLREREITHRVESETSLARVERNTAEAVRQAEGDLLIRDRLNQLAELKRNELVKDTTREHGALRERNEIDLARLTAEVEQMIARASALDPNLVHAISQFGDKVFVEKLVEAVGPVALTTGVTTADTFQQIFKGTPFEGFTKALAQRPYALTNGANGESDDSH